MDNNFNKSTSERTARGGRQGKMSFHALVLKTKLSSGYLDSPFHYCASLCFVFDTNMDQASDLLSDNGNHSSRRPNSIQAFFARLAHFSGPCTGIHPHHRIRHRHPRVDETIMGFWREWADM